jgi:hypothetical protein
METTGSCIPSALDPARAEAVQCTIAAPDATGATVEDPCFGNGGTFVLCAQRPTDQKVIRVDTTGVVTPTPNPPSRDVGNPWYLVLANNDGCLVAPPPAGSAPAGPTYTCTNGSVLSGIDRSGPSWTVSYKPAGADPAPAHVVTAYF